MNRYLLGAVFALPFAGAILVAYSRVKSTCENIPQITTAAQGAIKAHMVFPERAVFEKVVLRGVGSLDIEASGSVAIHDKAGQSDTRDFVVKLRCDPAEHSINYVDDVLSDHAAVRPDGAGSGG